MIRSSVCLLHARTWTSREICRSSSTGDINIRCGSPSCQTKLVSFIAFAGSISRSKKCSLNASGALFRFHVGSDTSMCSHGKEKMHSASSGTDSVS